MNPYQSPHDEPPVKAEPVHEKSSIPQAFEIAWRVLILLLVGVCLVIAAALWSAA